MYLAVLLAACSCGDAFTRLWAWHDWVITNLHMRVNPLDRQYDNRGFCWIFAGHGLRLALLMALCSMSAILARTHAIQLMLQAGMTVRVRSSVAACL